MTTVNVNQAKASLYQKIVKVMAKVERIPKNGYNSFHKYAYTTESDLVESARKLMVEEGLVLFNNVREYEIQGELATVTIDFTLCDVDTGESVTTCIVGQGTDRADKAFYKAYAGATKYYLMKTFLIPTGDDPEADATTDQRAYGKKNANKKSTANGQAANPNGQAANPSGGGSTKPISDKQKELIEQRVQELMLLVNQDEEAIFNSLKERVGDFAEVGAMTSLQASKCIEHLLKWKNSYSNRVQ